jgi:hypothetical protein
LAEIVVVVFPLTCPTVSNPDDDMLPGPEVTDQVAGTETELPSLYTAVAENWPELFSLMVVGPLIVR